MLKTLISMVRRGRPPPLPMPPTSPTVAETIAALPESAAAFGSLLLAEPAIGYGRPGPSLPLSATVPAALGPLLRDRPFYILLGQNWTLEDAGRRQRLLAAKAAYEAEYPRHHVIYLCNSDKEVSLLTASGHSAVVANHNILVDEAVFRPLADIAPRYDAIYNARLTPFKRHELAAEVPRLLLIYVYDSSEGSISEFHARHDHYRRILPQATFANRLTESGCERLGRSAVNQALASARVGLCLSAYEGAMLASIEYLMAGLPVVSTNSIGGRDRYFDDEYCLIVPDDPRAVAEAVAVLIARDIPREYIRDQTMIKIRRDRRHFATLINTLAARHGVELDFESVLISMIRGGRIAPWQSARQFVGQHAKALGLT